MACSMIFFAGRSLTSVEEVAEREAPRDSDTSSPSRARPVIFTPRSASEYLVSQRRRASQFGFEAPPAGCRASLLELVVSTVGTRPVEDVRELEEHRRGPGAGGLELLIASSRSRSSFSCAWISARLAICFLMSSISPWSLGSSSGCRELVLLQRLDERRDTRSPRRAGAGNGEKPDLRRSPRRCAARPRASRGGGLRESLPTLLVAPQREPERDDHLRRPSRASGPR